MNAYSIIEQLYNLWVWIAGLGAVLTIIPFFGGLVLNKRGAKDESERNNIPSYFSLALKMLGILLILGSLIVHNVYVRVPPLYGKTVRAAWQELAYTELNGGLSKGRLISENNYDCIVVFQGIETGILVPKGTFITFDCTNWNQNTSTSNITMPKENVFSSEMIIPDGYVRVPSVVDLEEEKAVQLLESSGLEASVWWLSSLNDKLSTYYIIEQSIPAGSVVAIGTKVEIQKSGVKNGTSVVVPRVVGMDQEEATALLTNTGLSFQVWWTEDVNNSSSEKLFIAEQSIPEGSEVPAGTVVRLKLGVRK